MRISDWSSDVCSSDLYSCIDGKMGAGRLARSSKKPAAPTASVTRTLRFLAGSRRLHSPSIPIRNEPDRWKGQDHAEYRGRSEEHTSELQSLMLISYAVFCLKKKNTKETHETSH